MEMNALAKFYKINVIVHQIDQPSMAHVFHPPLGSVPTIHLSYHLGSHYNSVRRKDDPCLVDEIPYEKYPIGHNLQKIMNAIQGD